MHVLGLAMLVAVGSVVGEDVSSCCYRLSINSSEEATEHQGNRLGEYRASGIFNDRLIYKHEEREEFLFYLTSRNRGLWMVGPEVGQFNGGLANKGDQVCAEDTPASQWKYTDGRSWSVDSSLAITCEEKELECVYSDQMDFEGGDLPEVLGGGGLVTSDLSSGECIEECEQREACSYWTWTGSQGVNCFLKTDKLNQVRRPKHVSGSVSSACQKETVALPAVEKDVEQKFDDTEINGKFRITSLKWDEKLTDPSSLEYHELSNSIEDSLTSMLRQERDLAEQADFTVKVQRFTSGSVVCDFKVNYVLKEAYVAIPFAIKPTNITDAMGKNFKFKKGILFQRFLIAADSFKASAPVDHCAAKGCSHKCDYDYDVEDYVCTCPRALTLDTAGLNCLTPEQAEAEKVAAAEVAATEDTDATTEQADKEAAAGDVEGRIIVTEKGLGEETTTIKAIDGDEVIVIDGETVEATTKALEVAGEKEVDPDEEFLAVTIKAPTEETTSAVNENVVAFSDATTLPPDVETIGSSDAGEEPVFDDGETTTEAAGTAMGDSETPGTEVMDGVATTEQDIKITEASTDAAPKTVVEEEEEEENEVDVELVSERGQETEATTQKSSLDCIIECGADVECMAQCIAEVIVPSETDSGTTSLPDILKMVPDIIDGVINTLFDGATTETALEKDKNGVTTDSTVITNDENSETTTIAGNVEFSTLSEIRPLEDPTIAEEETIEADEVAMATVRGITITEEENVEADESTTVSLEEDLVVDVEVTTVTIRDQTSGDEGVEGTTNTNKDSAITENKSFEDVETTTVILKDNTITAEENIDDVEVTTVTVDELTAKIPEGPEILDQATEVNTEEGVTTLRPKEPRLDMSNEATTAAGEIEETSLAGETVAIDDGMEDGVTTETPETDQPGVEGETTTKQSEMEEGEVITDMPDSITGTPGEDTGITVSAPSDTTEASVLEEMDEENVEVDIEMTTMAPTTVSVVSVEESEDGFTIVVTSAPVLGDMTTLRPAAEAGGDSEVTTRVPGPDSTEVGTSTRPAPEVTSLKTDLNDTTLPADDVTTLKPESGCVSGCGGETGCIDACFADEVGVEGRISEEDKTDEENIEVTTLKPASTTLTDGEAEMTTSKTDTELKTEAEVTDGEKPISMLTTQEPESESTTLSQETSEVTTSASTLEDDSLEVTSIDQEADSEVTTLPNPISEDATELVDSASPDAGDDDSEVSTAGISSVPEDAPVTTSRPADPVVTLLTTSRPTEGDESTSTTVPEQAEDDIPTRVATSDDGQYEFDCTELSAATLAFASPDQIPLECRLRTGGEARTVRILIPKKGLDLTRLFDNNVKVVVKDLMIMDISPKK